MRSQRPHGSRPAEKDYQISPHVGRNHSNISIVMRFPNERVLFAVDFIPVDSIAFQNFPDSYLDDWIESLRKVEAMDFEVRPKGQRRSAP